MTLTGARVCIIGAGAAGLSLARALSSYDIELSICDAGKAGQGAISAAAGMIAPGVEAAEALDPAKARHRAFHALAVHSARLWPDWSKALETDSGIPTGYRRKGALVTGRSSDGLQNILKAAIAFGAEAEMASDAPPLPGADAIIFPDEASLDARALAPALETAVRRAGVQIHEGVAVDRLLETGGRISGVRFADGREQGADIVIIAAGWAAARLHPALSGLEPVKGQALMLDAAQDVSHWPLIRGEGVYLAPKPGGRVIVGASVEPGVSDCGVDTLTRTSLLGMASALVAEVSGWRVIDHWAGVRPAFPDRLVRAGEVAPGLFVAAGAHRHGILLAPAIAEGLAAQIVSGSRDAHLAPFTPERG